MLSFDEILDGKILHGKYQQRIFVLVGLIQFCDGVIYQFMANFIALLAGNLSLTTAQQAHLGSSYLAGVVIGNLICAFFTDRIGRKTTLIAFTTLSCLLTGLLQFINSQTVHVYLRFFFGSIHGAQHPIGFLYMTEISITKLRGSLALAISMSFVLGKMYFVFLWSLFVDDFSRHDWKGLLIGYEIPALIVLVFTALYLEETIRFYINNGKYTKAFLMINDVLLENHDNTVSPLSSQEKDGLIANQIAFLRRIRRNLQSKKKIGLLSAPYRFQILLLCLLSALNSLENVCLYLLLPLLLNSAENGFRNLFSLLTAELVFIAVIRLIIDNPRYGRIRIVYAASLMMCAANISLFLLKDKVLLLGLMFVKLTVRTNQSLISIITSETFPLYLRSKAVGIVNAVERLIIIPAPYIMLYLYYIEPYLPFGSLLVIVIAMAYTASKLTDDKTQKQLEPSETQSSGSS